MLILKRNLDQRLLIGGNVVVVVTEIGNGWVKLGIEAPLDVAILREEAKCTEQRHTIPNTCDVVRRMREADRQFGRQIPGDAE